MMKSFLLLVIVAHAAHAQGSIPERTLPAPSVIGNEQFKNIAAIRELSDGRVIVAQRGPLPDMVRNMMAGAMKAAVNIAGDSAHAAKAAAVGEATMTRMDSPTARVVMFDAALKSITPVGQVGNGQFDYQQPQALIASRGDTTLLVELTRGDMLAIDPAGKITSSRPVPGGLAAQIGVGGAAIDRSGRLLSEPRAQTTRQTSAGMESGSPDSAAIVAADFKTGSTVPVAYVRVVSTMSLMQTDPATGATQMRMKTNPFPVIDDWVMLPDGTLALIRGADLHIDFIAPDGKRRSTPPIPHTRVAVADSDKVKFLKAIHMTDSLTSSMPMMPRNMTMQQQEPDSFPTFKPQFMSRAAHAASDGTIWLPYREILPTATEGWAVVGADGKVREIVHLPKGWRLVDFGKGVVYVAMGGRLGRIPLK